MMWVRIGWLLAMGAAMTLWVRRDAEQYRRFKAVEDSAGRRAFYGRWTAQSFAMLVGASLITLRLANELSAPFEFPAAFGPARAALGDGGPGRASLPGLTIGLVVGMTASIVLAAVMRRRRVRDRAAPMIGDVEPLLPRDGREALAALPLCLNAGFSEELFFRCALPVLLVAVAGSWLAAFGISTVAFGLVHAYQGWKGVVATMLAGAVLSALYVASASLPAVMGVHAAIDIVGLILRPTLVRWIAGRLPTARPI